MKKLIDLITNELEQLFEKCGYDKKYAKASVSNRPDLCEYQCNGALMAAKQYKKAPIAIANEITERMQENVVFQEVLAVNPGFINMKISASFLADFINDMVAHDKLLFEPEEAPKRFVIDYGGPNIAKPLHVGHLRSAIIGESVKRICKYAGNEVVGDVHLGDWGLQMGLIIQELKERNPELIYFDDAYDGAYPEEPPFTIEELEEIYPCANAKSKEDETFKEKARNATYLLQNGNRGYMAIWNHIINLSVTDLKEIYANLNVFFELWGKESDVQKYIPEMVQAMKDGSYTRISDGALVVDVIEESDTKEIPPCMILKSDGASLYNTTDLATIVQRMKDYEPDHMIYVVDKRQELYFEQVFRCARKTGLINENTQLSFLGFGTMNGKDGKPFKTRDGGVMRLEYLIRDINDKAYEKVLGNWSHEQETIQNNNDGANENTVDNPLKEEAKRFDCNARKTAEIVGLSALKYGDLSNQASKDYIFDIERFTEFHGNTGPYILYTISRIKSILRKFEQRGFVRHDDHKVLPAENSYEKKLMIQLSIFNEAILNSYNELAPHKICSYIYDLSDTFNKFYDKVSVLKEPDVIRRSGLICLIEITKKALGISIDLLGFEAPERM